MGQLGDLSPQGTIAVRLESVPDKHSADDLGRYCRRPVVHLDPKPGTYPPAQVAYD